MIDRNPNQEEAFTPNETLAVDPKRNEQLTSFVQRIERLESVKKDISEDIKEVKSAAKSSGFDIKILNKVLALRKLDTQERLEIEELISVYMAELGMR